MTLPPPRPIRLQVNGQPVQAQVEPRLTLADFLRERLRLTGTHLGCEHGVCGACTVLVDGRSVRGCLMLAVQADGAEVVTIEGIAARCPVRGEAVARGEATLSVLQACFRDHHALQCGFCTPGMIMSAVDIVRRKGNDLDEKTIRHELEGNICRCTGYHNIVKAIAAGAAAMAPAAE